MKKTWQIQEAKSQFSAVVEEALDHGPQIITKRGVETAVVLSYADYRAMQLNQQKLSQFFRESPLAEYELDLDRDASPTRQAPEL